jgi:asparagine synthase (glutamine-hydrolysing)
MCSVIGVFDYRQRGLSESDYDFIKNGFTIMRHRGPDCEDFLLVNDSYIVGHQRLSILDLSDAGRQPMCSTQSTISFNGEIYNYSELKESLMQSGCTFKSSTDTEVLQILLDHVGLEGLTMLNGMFAFAYYQTTSNTLHLVRDRFGVKPLYYFENDGKIYFSSELTPLFQMLPDINFNISAVEAYIKDTATDFSDTTFIKNIHQVEPGGMVSINANGLITANWYEIPSLPRLHRKNNLIDEYEEQLLDAIKLRLHADVPVCMTLSGGLDSSTIYTLIKERIGCQVSVFTFDHPGSVTSEINRVKNLTEKYGDKFYTVIDELDASQDIYSKIIEDLSITEYPIWSFSSRAYRSIYSEISKQGFKVVIEGHGADEVLGGYDYLIRHAAIDSLREFEFNEFVTLLNTYFATSFGSKNTINSKLRTVISCILSATGVRNKSNGLDNSIRDAISYKILPIVLRAFDRLSMHYSIESRCPFMDYRVIEKGLRLSRDAISNDLGNKAVLRQILKKYGNSFIYEYKAKHGFASNLPLMLSEPDLRERLASVIQDSSILTSFPREKSKAVEFFHSTNCDWSDLFEPSKIALIALVERNILSNTLNHKANMY